MKLTKSAIANALKVHRNTVKNMLDRGELRSQALEDVVFYAYEKGKSEALVQKSKDNAQTDNS